MSNNYPLCAIQTLQMFHNSALTDTLDLRMFVSDTIGELMRGTPLEPASVGCATLRS